MNRQTVFVTFANSTLDFQSIERVPSLYPARKGEVDFHFYEDKVIKVSEHGDCESLDLKTGVKRLWFTRPDMAHVITMGMKHRVGGYFYQFHEDGSIVSNCKEGTYYWGPEEQATDPEFRRLGGKSLTVAYWVNYMDDLNDLAWHHREFMERYEDEDHSDTYSVSYQQDHVEDQIAATKAWKAALEARLKNEPGVYENEANRKMHEQCIETATKEIDRLKGMQ